MRGALIQFMPTFLVPLPNVIIFQYNPESITHSWTQAHSAGVPGNPLAVRGMPGETFSMSIAVDAADMIADGSPVAEGIATASGIYTRLAALEMLLFPTKSAADSLLGSATIAAGAGGVSLGGVGGKKPADPTVPRSQVPVVIFVWGPGRIVPVRVTTLTITEKLYDGLLNPTHADATLGLTVLTPEELSKLGGDPLKFVAKAAYEYSQVLREALAVANLANSAESIIGMLPF
ncbi:MAG: hypothetical protein ABI759_28560 [Candidatus Solibacter sp.]